MPATKTVSLGTKVRNRSSYYRSEARQYMQTAKMLQLAGRLFRGVRVTTEEADNITVAAYGSSITIYTNLPGVAQRLANDLSLALETTFTKSFDSWSAQHSYRAYRVMDAEGNVYEEIDICGMPPESCKLEKVVVGTRTVEDTRWQVTCE